MTIENFKKHIQEIVAQAQWLCAAKTCEGKAPVNYACVFSQSEGEYQELVNSVRQVGTVVQDTAMGSVFRIASFSTAAGDLELLKIRRPDPNRKEMGDADFTVANYEDFKKKYLGNPGFKLIERTNMEMIELTDPSYNTVAYFSYPTLAEVLKIGLNNTKKKSTKNSESRL